MTTKKLVSGHFGQNCGTVDAIDGIGNVHQKQLPGTGRWSTSRAVGARCALRLRTHQACARRGLEKVACAPVHRMKRSCRDKAPRWPSDEGIRWVCRKGQQGGTAKPGSNLRRRSALELDGNHFSPEAKEVIPGSGTERLAQLMEPAPDDEGIELKVLRTNWTLTRQSERSGRAARGRRDLLAADLDEEHEAYRRKSRAKATGGLCARVEHARRKGSANTADTRVGIPRVGQHAGGPELGAQTVQPVLAMSIERQVCATSMRATAP